MNKIKQLYSGKAKSVYSCENEDYFILEFRDDTSAFDGKKMQQLERKGRVNNQFNAFIMKHLEEQGMQTHFVKQLSVTDSLVRQLKMIPLEAVVRNIAAGSICKRLGIAEGLELTPPTFELFLKDDALGDPMVNEFHALTFGWATLEQIEEMRELSFAINRILTQLFINSDMLLVDYKLEFGIVASGKNQGNIILGDEFTPDSCRLWCTKDNKKLDKDRFRQGMGEVVESYEIAGQRLGIKFE